MPSVSRQILVAILVVVLAVGIVSTAMIVRDDPPSAAPTAPAAEDPRPQDADTTAATPSVPQASDHAGRHELARNGADGAEAQLVRAPATNARVHLSDLRLLIADAVIGTDDDEHLLHVIEQRAAWVRDAAAQLAAPEDLGWPSTVAATPVDAVGVDAGGVDADLNDDHDHAVTFAWERVDHQREGLAAQLRQATDTAEEIANEAVQLRGAARAYAAAVDELPAGGEPDALREGWIQERERLTAYRDAANEAGSHTELAAHAHAHRALTDVMLDITDHAIEALDADDLEAYNDLVEALPARVADELDAIEDTLEDALVAAIAGIDTANARTTTLLNTLDVVDDAERT